MLQYMQCIRGVCPQTHTATNEIKPHEWVWQGMNLGYRHYSRSEARTCVSKATSYFGDFLLFLFPCLFPLLH